MWFVAVLISMTLAFASAVIVVKIEPAAGGSSIPDVMAYLNGITIRRFLGTKALVVKFFSAAFAISGGLYGGQEGEGGGGHHHGDTGWGGQILVLQLLLLLPSSAKLIVS